VFAAPGGAAFFAGPLCVLTRRQAGACPADKHTMALVVPVVFTIGHFTKARKAMGVRMSAGAPTKINFWRVAAARVCPC